MTIEKIINLLQNRLQALNNAKSTAETLGDINEVSRIDQEIIETETTLNQLRSL